MKEEEISWWMQQYPEISKEDIIDILKIVDGEDSIQEDAPTNYTDYLNPKPVKETGLKGILQNILHKKDS